MLKSILFCLWAFQLKASVIQASEVLDFEQDVYYRHHRVYDDTVKRLDYLNQKYPSWSHFNRTIGINEHQHYLSAFHIRHPDTKHSNNPIVYVQSLLKGSDWDSLSSATYLIEYILKNVKGNHHWVEYLKQVQLVVVPIVNREGHDFSMINYLPRMTTYHGNPEETGINLDRNFPYDWMSAKDFNVSSDYFPGDYPESEPELKIITNYLSQFTISAVLDLQSFGEKIMYPFGSQLRRGQNFDQLDQVAHELSAISGYLAASRRHGELGSVHGTFLDYVYNQCHESCLAYTVTLSSPLYYHLRPDGTFTDHYSDQIIPLGQLVTRLVIHLMQSVVTPYHHPNAV